MQEAPPTPPPAPPPPPVAAAPAELPPKAEWKATTSAVQEDQFAAANACDDKRDTRWSSPSSDPHWLQIDLGRPAIVCGATIYWETAYSCEYSILASLDGSEWKTVFATLRGDGNTDDVYFRPVEARYIKILGTKRATGWGHSIWEVDLKGPSEQVRVEAAGQAGSDPANLFDGDLETSWTAASAEPTSLTIDLRKDKALGGIRIDWGDGYPAEAGLFGSQDASSWNKLGEVKDGSGAFDVILFPAATVRHLRLDLGAGQKPVTIKEITLRGSDEPMTPLALYQLAAEKAKPGEYPEQLLRRQVYWTLVGLPGDQNESLLDEYGNFEAWGGSPSIMPYVFRGGELLSALDAKSVTQSLEGSYLPLPSVSWDLAGLRMDIGAFAMGTVNDSVSFVRYRLSNASPEPQSGRLFLVIRPVQINPPWQYGGLSPIRSLEFTAAPEGMLVRVNGTNLCAALVPPDGAGVRPFDQGDVARDLAKGQLPSAPAVADAGEFISGALAYDFDLQPGQSKDVILAAPLHENLGRVHAFMRHGHAEAYASPGEAFEANLQQMRLFWRDQIDKAVIELPDRAVTDTMKSQIAYILINQDGPSIQPGSRNYNRSWIRDGALTSGALLRMGLNDIVRNFLDWYAPRVREDGWVPPILENNGEVNKGFGWDNEYDSQGEFIFAVMDYYRFTRDRDFLAKNYPKVRAAMEYMVKLREQTLAPDYMKDEPARERFVGILPKSISHEGYSPAMHSYWDDFFALKGWKDGREAALAVGDTNTAAWAQEQYRLLRDSVKASIEATIRFKKIDFIPGCAEKGDMDATSTTIAFFPCDEEGILPPDILRHTYDRYYADVVQRQDPSWRGGFTPYEIRNLSAFVVLGQKDRAEFLLDYMNRCRRPPAWNHLAEVVLGDERLGSYIGDMPHTWVGSGYINAVRGMLVRELDGKLLLLRGAPEKWVREGNGVRIEKLPTYFGLLDMTAKADGQRLAVQLTGVQPPGGIELHWPIPGKPASVTVDGQPYTDFDEIACRVPATAKQIVATW